MKQRALSLVLAASVVAGGTWTTIGAARLASGDEPAVLIKRAHAGSHRPERGKPVFVLALGSDARKGNPERSRADSIHIVAIDPASKRASIVGIPRDSFVQVGSGRNKINSALAIGGISGMVAAVERLSGCDFDYAMLTAFEGFAKLVDEFGGVPVTVPHRMNDRFAKIDLSPGPQTLDGKNALGFARSRKTFARGDFARQENHGVLMIGALGRAREQVATSPGNVLRYLASVLRHVRVEIGIFEALELGMLALAVDQKDVTNIVVDGRTATVAGASIVEVTERGLAQLRDVCTDGLLS